MTDDPHEPYVPTPANDPADGPYPGEGPDDEDGSSTDAPKKWDEDDDIDPEMPDPTETDR